MSLRARLAAWLNATFWPGLDDRQPCLGVAAVVARLTPPAPQPRPLMPGLFGGLTPDQLRAGPRRVTADGAVHATPPPHVPPVPDDYRTRSREHAAARTRPTGA